MKMRERIVRAIIECDGRLLRSNDLSIAEANAYAEAVLAAMRDPTDEMVKAGDLPGWDGSITVDLSCEVWQAMIDAAITEGKT